MLLNHKITITTDTKYDSLPYMTFYCTLLYYFVYYFFTELKPFLYTCKYVYKRIPVATLFYVR